MNPVPRLVTLTIELRYHPSDDEQAVFDGADEDAQAVIEQALLRSAADLIEQVPVGASRFRLGTIGAKTGGSWISRFPS